MFVIFASLNSIKSSLSPELVCLFVLRFYGFTVNPMGSCQVWSVYLTTRLLGRLSPPELKGELFQNLPEYNMGIRQRDD